MQTENTVKYRGNISSDIKTMNFQKGGSLSQFSMRCNCDNSEDLEDKYEPAWQWFSATGKLAEQIALLRKGIGVVVEGYMKYRRYIKDGDKKEQTEVRINRIGIYRGMDVPVVMVDEECLRKGGELIKKHSDTSENNNKE